MNFTQYKYMLYVIATFNILFLLLILYLKYKLDHKNLVKKYNVKKQDTIAQNTEIRKSNGDSCNVSCLYKNGKLEKRFMGNLCNTSSIDCII